MTEAANKVSDEISGVVSEYLRLLRQPLSHEEVPVPFISEDLPPREARKPCALLLSPHPDDECLSGALPLRLKQELGWQIVNVAITLGSSIDRRMPRKAELAQACALLGFGGLIPVKNGFDDVKETARKMDPSAWKKKVERLAKIIVNYQPQAIFLPHAQDANATHIGTHLLAMDAMALQPNTYVCKMIHTEYWHPNASPNLMIGISAADTTKLLAALACHAGETARNPYDRRFPSYLIDNVRRGSERVGGAGTVAAQIGFAMLYHYGQWSGNKFTPSSLNRIIGPKDPLDDIARG